MLKSPNNLILLPFYLTVAVSLICVVLTFWSYRFTFAKWVIRIWMIELSVFAVIAMVHAGSGWFFTVDDDRIMLLEPSQIVWNGLHRSGHILFFSVGLFGLIFASLACATTFNPNLFGPARFTLSQIKFFRQTPRTRDGLDTGPVPPWVNSSVEPGFKEKLITGIAAFGLVYLPPFVWGVVLPLMEGRLPF
jgi:hypothetical protein